MKQFVAGTLLLLFLPASQETAMGKPWPQWRGADHSGVSSEDQAPTRWSRSENIAWRKSLPGQAGSTPVIWGDRIFLTSANGDELILLCISTEGKELWRRTLSTGNESVRGDEGNYASPSPATDGKCVWALVGTGNLACYTIEGDPVWKLDLQQRYGKFNIQFGMASTPILDENRLYLQLIHGDGNPRTREAAVVCLDAATGGQIWRADRPSDARAECEHSYASPTLYRDAEHELLITHGADYVVAYRLKDGREVWRCGGLNPPGSYNPTLRFVSSPVASEGMIVVPSAKKGPVVALSPAGQGDVTNSDKYVLWRYPRNTPDVPSPLIYDGLVYLCRENGNLICLDAKTGEQVYEERTVRDRHRASPLLADGKLYLTSRQGVVTVLQAGRDFKMLSQNDIEEPIASSPILADGVLYLRTFESLIAVREDEKK